MTVLSSVRSVTRKTRSLAASSCSDGADPLDAGGSLTHAHMSPPAATQRIHDNCTHQSYTCYETTHMV